MQTQFPLHCMQTQFTLQCSKLSSLYTVYKLCSLCTVCKLSSSYTVCKLSSLYTVYKLSSLCTVCKLSSPYTVCKLSSLYTVSKLSSLCTVCKLSPLYIVFKLGSPYSNSVHQTKFALHCVQTQFTLHCMQTQFIKHHFQSVDYSVLLNFYTNCNGQVGARGRDQRQLFTLCSPQRKITSQEDELTDLSHTKAVRNTITPQAATHRKYALVHLTAIFSCLSVPQTPQNTWTIKTLQEANKSSNGTHRHSLSNAVQQGQGHLNIAKVCSIPLGQSARDDGVHGHQNQVRVLPGTMT